MAKNEVVVGKIFSFDAAHQLTGHFGKCANLHGHTYKLEVLLKGVPRHFTPQTPEPQGEGVHVDSYYRAKSNEGFVIDFYDLKKTVNELIVDKLDHAFIARGDEPALQVIKESGAKHVVLGFRTTVENMARYICWRLMKAGLPMYAVRMWETPTGWAEVYAEDIDLENGPDYASSGACDLDDDDLRPHV